MIPGKIILNITSILQGPAAASLVPPASAGAGATAGTPGERRLEEGLHHKPTVNLMLVSDTWVKQCLTD